MSWSDNKELFIKSERHRLKLSKKKKLTKEMKYVSIRLRLVRVKAFLENISFSENAIFRKGKCIQVFGCVGIRFTENQFRCLVRTNILWKMKFIFYRKSFLMFGLWIILQKITIPSTCIT